MGYFLVKFCLSGKEATIVGTYETVLTAVFFVFALLLFGIGIQMYRGSRRAAEACSCKEALRHAAMPLLFGLILLLSALWILTRAGWLMLIVSLIAAAAIGLTIGGGLGGFLQKR